jgi:hypothetical protein
VAVDDAQNRIFWSGILIGIAGGAAVALALELIGLLEKRGVFRRTKGKDKIAQEAKFPDKPGHQGRRSGGVGIGESPDPPITLGTRPGDLE